jgi:hypothetical protein
MLGVERSMKEIRRPKDDKRLRVIKLEISENK